MYLNNNSVFCKITLLVMSGLICLCFTCCHRGERRFKPEVYFDTDNVAELSMAKAIYNGETWLVKKYLKSNAVDINKPGKSGFTYLLYAIYIEQYDVAKILLENGADPSVRCIVSFPDGEEELTPLSVVCGNHWYPMKYYKLLVENGANINDPRMPALPICIAMSGKKKEKVIYLIEHGADLNLPWGGFTPLECCVTSRNLDIVDLLYDYGADPFITEETCYNFAFMLQDVVDQRLGTQEYIDHAKAIMARLKKEGVKFPVPKLPTDYFEDKTDSIKTRP